MRHISYINEFSHHIDKIDKDYIKSVFIDLIENGAVIENTNDPREDDNVCQVIIPIPKLEFKYRSDIDKLIEHSIRYTNLLMDVKSCIGRVIDEFPNMNMEQFLTEKQNYGNSLVIKFYRL